MTHAKLVDKLSRYAAGNWYNALKVAAERLLLIISLYPWYCECSVSPNQVRLWPLMGYDQGNNTYYETLMHFEMAVFYRSKELQTAED